MCAFAVATRRDRLPVFVYSATLHLLPTASQVRAAEFNPRAVEIYQEYGN